MLDHLPGEREVVHLTSGRLEAGHCHVWSKRLYLKVLVLIQAASVDVSELFHCLRHLALVHVHDYDAGVLLVLFEELDCFRGERRSHDDFQEYVPEFFGKFQGDFAVECHYAAIDGNLVTLESLFPCIENILPDRSPARVHVLEAHGEWLIEFAHDVEGGISILNIIVAQFFPAQLGGCC